MSLCGQRLKSSGYWACNNALGKPVAGEGSPQARIFYRNRLVRSQETDRLRSRIRTAARPLWCGMPPDRAKVCADKIFSRSMKGTHFEEVKTGPPDSKSKPRDARYTCIWLMLPLYLRPPLAIQRKEGLAISGPVQKLRIRLSGLLILGKIQRSTCHSNGTLITALI